MRPDGLSPAIGASLDIRAPSCPAFGNVLDQGQVTDLLAYLRARYTDEPDWPNAAAEVARIAAEANGRPKRSVAR